MNEKLADSQQDQVPYNPESIEVLKRQPSRIIQGVQIGDVTRELLDTENIELIRQSAVHTAKRKMMVLGLEKSTNSIQEFINLACMSGHGQSIEVAIVAEAEYYLNTFYGESLMRRE